MLIAEQNEFVKQLKRRKKWFANCSLDANLFKFRIFMSF